MAACMPTLTQQQILVINIMKHVIHKGGSVSIQDVNAWIQRNCATNQSHSRYYPDLKELIGEYLQSVFVIGGTYLWIKNDCNICKDYWTREGCNQETCNSIHICMFVVQKSCSSTQCNYSHRLDTSHNVEVLSRYHLLRYLNNDELLKLFSFQMSLNISEQRQTVQVCKFYNTADGCKFKNGKGCPALHICVYYPSQSCKFGSGCKRSHNILDPQPKFILERLNWDIKREPQSLLADIYASINGSDNAIGNRVQTCKVPVVDTCKVPKVCWFYNKKDGCKNAERCKNLHICNHYIINDCQYGQRCIRSHNIYDDQPKFVLAQNKWDVQRSPKEVLSDLRDAMPGVVVKPSRGASITLPRADDHNNCDISIDTRPNLVQYTRDIDDDYVPRVCVYHLSGNCNYKTKCRNMHTDYPYLWQYSDKDHGKTIWTAFKTDEQSIVEQCYIDPENDFCAFHVLLGLTELKISFDHMSYTARNAKGKIRRLCTYSWGDTPITRPFVTKWLWYWQDEKTKWFEYGVEGGRHNLGDLKSRQIEEKYLENNNGEITFKAGRFTYRLNFKDMMQENTQTGKKRPVTRRPDNVKSDKGLPNTIDSRLNDVTYPDDWEVGAKSQDETYQIVKVPNGSDEYCLVEKLFSKTMPGNLVKRIQRIQNYDLWELYFRKRNRMLRHVTHTSLNELQLFHGTKKVYINAICQQGFDWRLTGTSSGTSYGKGSYFAKKASYSKNYTDCRTVFLVKVLVGDYTIGSSNTVRPPAKDRSNPNNDFYDSCVNDESNPKIYVIFDQHQSYPQYMIEY